MVFFQIIYELNIWVVVIVGVVGSILGRYILTLYIPKLSGRIFSKAKNEDVEYLGNQMKKKGWKGPAAILIYSLLPLPTTPLFIAGGMAKMKPQFMIPPFIIGKFISDAAAVFTGKYASNNVGELFHGLVSWKSITGLALGLLLLFLLVFVDWRTLLQRKKFQMKFKIWK